MKSKETRPILGLLALLVIAGGLLWTLGDDTAPDVEFTTLSGERFRLRDWRGHPVLVSFWASDCRACLEEMPDLSALHRDYAARGLRLIAVAMPYDPPNRVVALTKAMQLPFPVALDPWARITGAFGRVQLVPNSFLIAPDGRITLHRLGRLQSGDFRGPIERMLGET